MVEGRLRTSRLFFPVFLSFVYFIVSTGHFPFELRVALSVMSKVALPSKTIPEVGGMSTDSAKAVFRYCNGPFNVRTQVISMQFKKNHPILGCIFTTQKRQIEKQ